MEAIAAFFEPFITKISEINDVVNNFVWGSVMLVAFLFVGILFTVRTGFFQFRRIKDWFSETILKVFTHKSVRKTDDKSSISQFQALATALAATIGTGNIAGVATAIAAGGPGAVFWMWVSALFGTMTNYAENTLGIKYRYKNEKGNWVGGAMIYMERGLKCKPLAVIFSIFCLFASFGIGNMTQGNSIATALGSSFKIPTIVTGVVIAGLVALVIFGGIKRIASVTEKIVPFMAVGYIIGGLICIFMHASAVPEAFKLIFTQAFEFKSVAGGVAGYGIAMAMRCGISRGVFSNEAGLGSSVMVHSASDVKEPVVQGMWGIFEVFSDTLVVCTITALVILTSGVYNMGDYIRALSDPAVAETLKQGVDLTSYSFDATFGVAGEWFVSVALMLFAFSTILGWSYYGERAVEYLFGIKAVPVYKVIFVLIVAVGCCLELDLVWGLSDTFNGLMAIPNLIAVTLLSGQVASMTNDYLNRTKGISKAKLN